VIHAALAPVVIVLIAGGCSYSRTEYTPDTSTSDVRSERLLVQLERAVNAKDAAAICALYADPTPSCESVWKRRLRVLPTPVTLTFRTITGGCAGDARVSYIEKTRVGRHARTLTVVTVFEGTGYSLIDVAFGRRLSSLVIPRYGDCANFDDGSAGSPNLDPASGGGQGNGW
jgi:hypothetical protein